jgi:predicted GIY-YIG superfamily endonuclease
MEKINIENQCLLYFFFNKTEKVYIGETTKGYGRFYQHKDKKFDKHNVRYISSKKLNFLNHEYFRKYYELRLINRFKPRYNKETTTAPSLNDFIGDVDGSGNMIEGQKIFVSGEKVNDFHYLKKDAIWTVATAAVQELDRKVADLEARLAVLEGN